MANIDEDKVMKTVGARELISKVKGEIGTKQDQIVATYDAPNQRLVLSNIEFIVPSESEG